jgi:hypothetical protein
MRKSTAGLKKYHFLKYCDSAIRKKEGKKLLEIEKKIT